MTTQGDTGAKDDGLAAMAARWRRLPRRHRVAHLRALIRGLPPRSIRRFELAELLRAEAATPACESWGSA